MTILQLRTSIQIGEDRLANGDSCATGRDRVDPVEYANRRAVVRLNGWRAMQTFWDRRSAGRVHGFAVVIAEVVAIGLIMTTPMTADHLEKKLQALGKPEHMLSRVKFKTTIAEVIKIYGEPTDKRDVPAQGVKDGVGGEVLSHGCVYRFKTHPDLLPTIRNPQKTCQAPKPHNPVKTREIPIAWELSPIRYN
jgi:hypothetical protein